MSPDSNKVTAQSKITMPQNQKQVRALIEGINYAGKFLANLSGLIHSIYALLKQGVKFIFSPAMETTVHDILSELAKHPTLIYPDWDLVAENPRSFRLYCDTTIHDSFGATLDQEQPDGTGHPIVFISRATLDPERNWTPPDLEARNIVWGNQTARRSPLLDKIRDPLLR